MRKIYICDSNKQININKFFMGLDNKYIKLFISKLIINNQQIYTFVDPIILNKFYQILNKDNLL